MIPVLIGAVVSVLIFTLGLIIKHIEKLRLFRSKYIELTKGKSWNLYLLIKDDYNTFLEKIKDIKDITGFENWIIENTDNEALKDLIRMKIKEQTK